MLNIGDNVENVETQKRRECCSYFHYSEERNGKEESTSARLLKGCLLYPFVVIIFAVLATIIFRAQDKFDATVHERFRRIAQTPTVVSEYVFNSGTGCPKGCKEQKKGCDIKGNISYRSGAKIYHVPGQEYYKTTIINPEYGERWFCTEAEARANGWRKSYE